MTDEKKIKEIKKALNSEKKKLRNVLKKILSKEDLESLLKTIKEHNNKIIDRFYKKQREGD